MGAGTRPCFTDPRVRGFACPGWLAIHARPPYAITQSVRIPGNAVAHVHGSSPCWQPLSILDIGRSLRESPLRSSLQDRSELGGLWPSLCWKLGATSEKEHVWTCTRFSVPGEFKSSRA